VGGDVHRLLESRDPHLAVSSSMGSVDAAMSPPAYSSAVPWLPPPYASSSAMGLEPGSWATTMLRPSPLLPL
jgi:hypothetical protein